MQLCNGVMCGDVSYHMNFERNFARDPIIHVSLHCRACRLPG